MRMETNSFRSRYSPLHVYPYTVTHIPKSLSFFTRKDISSEYPWKSMLVPITKLLLHVVHVFEHSLLLWKCNHKLLVCVDKVCIYITLDISNTDISKYFLHSKNIVWTYVLSSFTFQLLLPQTTDTSKVNFLEPENLL